ncbi:pseudouridine synthase [Phenylobacterium immobile]|uniref:pseudouridine synthase n=1 Tax=Phenylobacterium immobile TaxID=21 RepID=UPI000B86E471|nr:pseudouridine synthase [Phenylobacterium immobile]
MVHDPLRTGAYRPGQARPHQDNGEDDGDDDVILAAGGEGERVAKALARAGVASRRDVERLIAEGRVALNGQTLTTPAVKVEPGDILTVDGEVVGDAEPTRLFRYHKPVGLVTSHKDPQGRPTVFANLPGELPRLISVGRLDINTEGLLLLTNDGELARALELPATALPRRYRARAHGRITQAKLDTLKAGVTVEGVHYGPIEATLDKAKEGPAGANLWITITLAEGKNREVRRVLESVGLKVNRLLRLSYGPFALGTLEPGEVDEIGPRVLREQMVDYIDPANMPAGERPLYRRPATPNRPRRTPADAMVPSPPEAPQKKVYKAGWAKAKPKASPHGVGKSRPFVEKDKAASPIYAKPALGKNGRPLKPGEARPVKYFYSDGKPPSGNSPRKKGKPPAAAKPGRSVIRPTKAVPSTGRGFQRPKPERAASDRSGPANTAGAAAPTVSRPARPGRKPGPKPGAKPGRGGPDGGR